MLETRLASDTRTACGPLRKMADSPFTLMSDTLSTPAPAAETSLPSRARQFYALTKPRVVQLIVFCAFIVAACCWHCARRASMAPWCSPATAAAFALLVAGAAAALQLPGRAAHRLAQDGPAPHGVPTARGRADRNTQTLLFSAVLCAYRQCLLLYWLVNPLTMWLTFATFVGYAVIYTVVLKPMTPQNIVIGGASGAMPPVLGWAALRGDVGPEALMLLL